jgi:hypothetical protein
MFYNKLIFDCKRSIWCVTEELISKLRLQLTLGIFLRAFATNINISVLNNIILPFKSKKFQLFIKC